MFYSQEIDYICNIKEVLMIVFLRNIIAFISTFVLISTMIMIIVQGLTIIVRKEKEISNNQEIYIAVLGIIVALLLIPFYFFPA